MKKEIDPPIPLTEWGVKREEGDGYRAPESLRIYLVGHVESHPKYPKRKRPGWISTNYVQDVNGRIVETESGRRYELVGPPSKSYAKFARENGIKIDDKQPIRIIERRRAK